MSEKPKTIIWLLILLVTVFLLRSQEEKTVYIIVKNETEYVETLNTEDLKTVEQNDADDSTAIVIVVIIIIIFIVLFCDFDDGG